MTKENFKEFIGVSIFFGLPYWAVIAQFLN